MNWESATIGAVGGTLCWEILKQVLSSISKRTLDSRESLRRLFREDTEKIIGLVCEIQDCAFEYYTTEFNGLEAKTLSKKIKIKSKSAGLKISAINVELNRAGKDQIPLVRWTAFKLSTAKHLDVTRSSNWADDDPRMAEIYKAAHHFHTELNRIRYQET